MSRWFDCPCCGRSALTLHDKIVALEAMIDRLHNEISRLKEKEPMEETPHIHWCKIHGGANENR